MEEKDKNQCKNTEPLDLTPLDEQTKDIAQKILLEQDVDTVKDLTQLFNLNMRKKNVARVIKMNDLLDKVTEQVVERFEKKPDNFSNDDLIKYFQITENAIDKATKNLNLVEETPPIQYLQQNQVNINIENNLDRDGRQRVLEAIHSLLQESNTDVNISQNLENVTQNEGEHTDV